MRTPIQSSDDIVISSGINFNSDSSFIKKNSSNYPEIKKLEKAIDENIKNLGQLIFILIGNFDNLIENKIAIKLGCFDFLEFSNHIDLIEFTDDTIIMNPKYGNEIFWKEVDSYANFSENERDKKKQEFDNYMKTLRKETILPLILPHRNSDLENTFIDGILNSIQSEIVAYDKSLQLWLINKDDQINYNNILRISYNFSGDAMKLLKLIISICDLKPILLWMTIYSQYKLKKAFDLLGLGTGKPILVEYDNLIKGARNSRFHKLFEVNNTINVDLSGINLKAKKLIIFPEYTRNNQTINSLEYEDQQLVDVFSEFTRVTENKLSDDFWVQNLEIMKAFHDLLQNIGDSIKLLRLA